MKLMVVIGTRPECIKLAPIIRKAPEHGVNIITCVTGQHQEMLAQCLDIFGIVPDIDLSAMRHGQTLTALTARLLDGISPVLDQTRPDAVIVQGDTTTAFASGLAAYYKRIPVGHVEAGLRTYDLYSPFPEEAMRQMITRIAKWHFAPTLENRDALIKEGIKEKAIYITGNTVIDSLLWTRDNLARNLRRDLLDLPDSVLAFLSNSDRRLVLITGHRRENFGEGIRGVCDAIRSLATQFTNVDFVYPVHLNPNVVEPVYRILAGIPNVHLINPVNYYTFVYLMSNSDLIISDSGGIQEEAPSLGIPVLVTREVTERREAVEAGVVTLVGCDRERITTEAYRVLRATGTCENILHKSNLYGTGKAADAVLGVMLTEIGGVSKSVIGAEP